MKLALIIAIYKRHDLESLVIERFKNQSKKYGFEIILAGSEGEVSKSLADGCHYIEIENKPLGRKHNALLTKAKELNVDGVVLFGSDDFVNDKYWDFIYTHDSNENQLVGFKDLFFYSTNTKKFGYYQGWAHSGQSIGAGRFFSRTILDLCDWKLWEDYRNKGLDSSSSVTLRMKNVSERIYSMEEKDVFILDVKHTYSITDENILNACDEQNINIMAKRLGKETAQKIESLEIKEEVIIKVDDTNPYEIVKILSTGKYKEMPKGDEYEVTKEIAKELVRKGFAKLV